MQIYLLLWLLSCIAIFPGRLSASLDETASDQRNPVKLGRCICIAPALFIVDWEEGEGAFNSAGWQGLVVHTPWKTRLLMRRMSWIS
jgi:hypothetical protein